MAIVMATTFVQLSYNQREHRFMMGELTPFRGIVQSGWVLLLHSYLFWNDGNPVSCADDGGTSTCAQRESIGCIPGIFLLARHFRDRTSRSDTEW